MQEQESDVVHLMGVYLSILHAAGDQPHDRALALFMEELHALEQMRCIERMARKWEVLEIQGMRIIG